MHYIHTHVSQKFIYSYKGKLSAYFQNTKYNFFSKTFSYVVLDLFLTMCEIYLACFLMTFEKMVRVTPKQNGSVTVIKRAENTEIWNETDNNSAETLLPNTIQDIINACPATPPRGCFKNTECELRMTMYHSCSQSVHPCRRLIIIQQQRHIQAIICSLPTRFSTFYKSHPLPRATLLF